MTDSLLLVGNNLAVLVAACERVAAGRPVTLLTDGRAPGGHFGGMSIEGHAFDIGMVLLEKVPSPPRASPLGSYDPARRNDWTRFADRASQWLDAQLPLRHTPTPSVRVGGRVGPDYLMANRLDLLRDADCPPPPPLPRDDPRHAAHKTHGAAYEHMSYAEAALHNHGDAFHARYIEPFVRKLLDASSGDFLARYHRAGWVPLYYPETLAAGLRGEATGLPEYRFLTTEAGFVGELVARLRARLAASPLARIVDTGVQSVAGQAGAWCARTADGATWDAAHLAMGLPPERCLALLGLAVPPAPRAASVALMFCLVASDAIGHGLACEMVVDEDHATYRISDQDALAGRDPPWHRVAVEASPHLLAARGGDAQAVLADELRALMRIDRGDALRVLRHMNARNALALPTGAAVETALHTHHAIAAALPGAALSGALLGHGVASFNDQVVQGLKIAEETR